MEKFSLNNQVEKVLRGENTSFLNPIDSNYVINKLKANNCYYKPFLVFKETEKIVIYQEKLNISIFKIETKNNLTHSEILGSLYSHNLKEDTFGDIIINDDKYYIIIDNKIKKYMINSFNRIGNKKIKLIETNLEEVSNYHPKFKEINIQISSLRMDGIIAKIIPTSRSIGKNYISSQKVMVNYKILKNSNYNLKENDIFSIRGVGKFKFSKIITITKTGKYQIKILKYI